MRFHLKLLAMIALFVAASRPASVAVASDVAYHARVAFVCAFGTPTDYEALLDDSQHPVGREMYLLGERYQKLLAKRLATAACQKLILSEENLDRIRAECLSEALAERDPAWP